MTLKSLGHIIHVKTERDRVTESNVSMEPHSTRRRRRRSNKRYMDCAKDHHIHFQEENSKADWDKSSCEWAWRESAADIAAYLQAGNSWNELTTNPLNPTVINFVLTFATASDPRKHLR